MTHYELKRLLAIRHAKKVKQRQILHDIRHKNDKKKKPIAFSKLAFIIIFLDCLLIQLFSMWIMVYLADASNLGALIGIAVALIGEVGTCVSYNRKSMVENSSGGIVYESYIQSIKGEDELTEEELNNAVG